MRPRVLLAALAVLAAAIVGSRPPGWPLRVSAQVAAPPVFTVQSELVVLHVMVKDRKGAYITNLPSTAFTVLEDEQRQTVSFFAPQDAPVTVGLLVDSSGSMQSSRARVVTAAGAFAASSNPEDEMFAMTFNENVRAALAPAEPFTTQADVLQGALERAISARGLTGLYDAILSGIAYSNRGSHLRKALVVVSDGGDNASEATFEQVLRRTQAANTVIYTIALVDPAGDTANPQLLRRLADGSGGEAFDPRRTSDVVEVMRHVARDLRNTYTLGYVPAGNAEDGRFRRIRVLVGAPGGKGLTVRTRQGYVVDGGTADRR